MPDILPIFMHQATEIVFQNKDWMTYVYLGIFTFLVGARLIFDKRLYQNTTLFLSRKYLSIYYSREKRSTFTLFQSTLIVPQILVVSLFFNYLGNYLSPMNISISFDSFIRILAGVTAYFAIRFLVGIIISSILNLKKPHQRVLYEKTSYFNNLILWLLPFLIFTSYSPYNHELNLKLTAVIFIFLAVMRYGLLIMNNKKLIINNLFYFILYLCALEIAPLLIITKTTI